MKLIKKHPKTGLHGIGLFEWGIWWLAIPGDFRSKSITFDLTIGVSREFLSFHVKIPPGQMSFNFYWGYSFAQEKKWAQAGFED